MITHVDYSLIEAIMQYKDLVINHSFIFYLLGALIVFGFLIFINLNTKTSFIITLLSFIVVVGATFWYRGLDMFNHIDSIFNLNFYQNIFFYYWNVIIGTLIMHIVINGKSNSTTKKIVLLFYVLTIANVAYSFYISSVVFNEYILVLGNIAPIIILGNVLLFITYFYLIILKLVEAYKKGK